MNDSPIPGTESKPKDSDAAEGNSSTINETRDTPLTGEKIIAIGQQRVHVNAVTSKIRDDIAFLQDRIHRMEQMKSPNQTVLNTYKAMLESRRSVLRWLEEHKMITPTPVEEKAPKVG